SDFGDPVKFRPAFYGAFECPFSLPLIEGDDGTNFKSVSGVCDNVFLLRKAKRLPQQKRPLYEEVKRQHQENPIDKNVMWQFVQEIQRFVDAVWYDPSAALHRGSFV
ncbi:MAG: Bpu10I family restriction endonuclease, partial [Alphaproteobacteria bacterium]|nr:Bpu10I family restriction endonuclease [Alphaproteobacteria bacterium]